MNIFNPLTFRRLLPNFGYLSIPDCTNTNKQKTNTSYFQLSTRCFSVLQKKVKKI